MPLSQIVSASIEDGAVAPVDLSSVAQYTGFKNRLINAGMVIDQRNAGASVTPTTDAQYGSCDRWSYFVSQASKFSVQQNAGSVTPPAGYTNYLGVTSLSAYTPISNDYFGVIQKIEGYNVADLGFGTANAATTTLSFWVRSSLTGTFGGALCNGGYTRSYPFTYTISAANTWEQKSVTIAGDTSGTWLTTNGQGLVVQFGLGAVAGRSGTAGAWASAWYITATGATNVISTNGATLYITGVQFEKGVTATSFDYRPYGTELQLCQRYYETGTTGQSLNNYGITASVSYTHAFKASKRTTPVCTVSTGAFQVQTTEAFSSYQSGIANGSWYNPGTFTATAEL